MNSKTKILLVEDEPHLAFTLKLNLEAEGYDVIHESNGKAALQTFNASSDIKIILLDGMLPEMDGFDVAKAIRKKNQTVSILMLTARAGESDRLEGFSSGVDDYIAKPFHLQELLARIKRASERSELYQKNQALESVLTFGEFELDSHNLILRRGGQVFEVTKLEADLLKTLIQHRGNVVSREDLLQKVWGVSTEIETRTVDNFILRLRKMMEDDPKNPVLLLSVRGRGYKLVDK